MRLGWDELFELQVELSGNTVRTFIDYYTRLFSFRRRRRRRRRRRLGRSFPFSTIRRKDGLGVMG